MECIYVLEKKKKNEKWKDFKFKHSITHNIDHDCINMCMHFEHGEML